MNAPRKNAPAPARPAAPDGSRAAGQWIARIEALDVGLFGAIPSQTTPADRRSLLAVQRATAARHGTYVYLEIGSHLGGSLQPHLLDERCTRIYSIDPRPQEARDERADGCRVRYDGNSTARMLRLLEGIGRGRTAKIECFDTDASRVDPRAIARRPALALIDGEHTTRAALADFDFCSAVLSRDGTILFHDFPIVYPAIAGICRRLDRQRCPYLALKLEGTLFAIFFAPALADADPYLRSLRARHRGFLERYLLAKALKRRVKAVLPAPVLGGLRRLKRSLKRRPPARPAPPAP